ncbi:hypothetical protein FG476_01990 [Xylella fastidiosa subsp. multiplex]|uniref:Uncharacterized protein n=1 Tax=Xylella fastidiosa subsp. multiplex TaxID=644357 RepID=A0A9Q4QRU6_XYLFS|nr:hypothetical protein [Xylella fastidiosa]MBE0269783.1 hypothetical protein [Xylella fastidiosa subsp. multiplex]MBE0276397.1 hypothetical protein [Xylella fastidiosa subsp. multiplex]MBE0278603.1 hypothetical protein [Xylella fastidiosa subsp. multiplex]MBE0282998.1 hypothetical protein [Xylella fastidiosa subsp. multiplex]MRT52467.1 hypothetical protein [Xylella fastidiosa subsp. multiplex]
MKCQTRPFGGPVKIDLTPAVQKIFEQYAQIYGLACVDEAVEHAAKQALKDAYLLRAKNGHSPLGKGVVIYLKGLKKPLRNQE